MTLGPDTRVRSVNAQGVMVGQDQGLATIWTSSEHLQVRPFDGSTGEARGVNDHGEVVGAATTPDGLTHGFVYSNGAISDLGTLGGRTSVANAISDTGIIVGAAEDSELHNRAFAWQRSSGMKELTTLGGSISYATAIDPFGTNIVGAALNTLTQFRAVLWVNGTNEILDLGTVGGSSSFAYGVNGTDVVGWSYDVLGRQRAFIWTAGVMWDLNTLVGDPAWTLLSAYGINPKGEIVGEGIYQGQRSAFRLSPSVTSSAQVDQLQSDIAALSDASVPESSTFGLLLSAAAAMLFLRCRDETNRV